ncbi:Uncharacterized protein APZ42_012816 [Daphnia magna]|uniref:Uncharacterized protein n=2 Tax=Daphnia magna TaxID=35525 RepID=A0ABR0ALX6_9CRUS|nr:hypothetical protein OUZ56_015147 [Daphnia magna]KZS20429.1 Uncharacterized protein APZ42_012816 [Daphnia magna]
MTNSKSFPWIHQLFYQLFYFPCRLIEECSSIERGLHRNFTPDCVCLGLDFVDEIHFKLLNEEHGLVLQARCSSPLVKSTHFGTEGAT